MISTLKLLFTLYRLIFALEKIDFDKKKEALLIPFLLFFFFNLLFIIYGSLQLYKT